MGSSRVLGCAARKARHFVSAWRNRITLGQLKADEKTREITAAPELMDMLDAGGGVIEADCEALREPEPRTGSAGRSRETASKFIKKAGV